MVKQPRFELDDMPIGVDDRVIEPAAQFSGSRNFACIDDSSPEN
ncbi:MAG: hypothetical protein ACREP6_15495 [Candidatus Binataceae bacterium]